MIATWDVVVELVALLRYRLSFRASEIFLKDVMPGLSVIHPNDAEREAAIAYYLKHSIHRRLSLCDALSYVIVSTRLDWAPCLSFDDDFAAMGLTVVR